MGTKDKASNETQDLKGNVKEVAGSATGNPSTHPTTRTAMSGQAAPRIDLMLGSLPPCGGNGLPDLAGHPSPQTFQARGAWRHRPSPEQDIQSPGWPHSRTGSQI